MAGQSSELLIANSTCIILILIILIILILIIILYNIILYIILLLFSHLQITLFVVGGPRDTDNQG